MIKKLVSITLSLVLVMGITTSAFAGEKESIDNIVNEENLIEENNYYDEELQAQITEQTYFVPDNLSDYSKEMIAVFSNNKGSGWFIKKKECQEWVSGKTTTIYAKGHFKWNDGEVSLYDDSESGGYDYIDKGARDIKPKLTKGKGGLPFARYAYVRYNLKFKTNVGIEKEFDVKLTVNGKGKTNGEEE